MSSLRSPALLFLCLFLSACANGEPSLRLCPQVAIIRALERAEDHAHETPVATSLVAGATMTSVDGYCEQSGNGIDVFFDLKMTAYKGPRLGGSRASFPFFVSVLSPESEILNKELMTTTFLFPEEKGETEKTEALHVFLPLGPNASAQNHRVFVGFQLTPEQYAFLQKTKP